MKNKSWIFPLIVVLVVGYFGYPYLVWAGYARAVRLEMSELGHFPSLEKLEQLHDNLVDEAKDFKFEQKIETTRILDHRKEGLIHFWVVVVKVSSGSKTYTTEHRVEHMFTEAEVARLEEAGFMAVDKR